MKSVFYKIRKVRLRFSRVRHTESHTVIDADPFDGIYSQIAPQWAVMNAVEDDWWIKNP